MRAAWQPYNPEHNTITSVRALANQAFSRAAGAPLVEGNQVRLLKDARENYPAWLDAIGAAKRHVHFENYIIYDDNAGQMFADALIAKAQEGVRVRLIYDWMGGFGKTSRRFWNRLRAGGVEVRRYNPPRLESPLGWLSRDHRKMLVVDGEIGFITGLCVGRMWIGVPEEGIEPWRDTGIEVRGPSVADIEEAFSHIWGMIGEPIPESELVSRNSLPQPGKTAIRVVATMPATAGLFRLDQLVAALARKRLWLTDAYFAGTTSYMQALRAAAKDGVDVRLLVPGGSDIPLLSSLSRAGYRSLLEAGVRVFEWNGTMLHAKSSIADGRWTRIGSTNLNISSWFGNCELDVVVEDELFAGEVEEMYLHDLTNSTEVVLHEKRKVRRATGEARHRRPVMTSGGGSGGRAAAGAVRIGNTVGAAFTGRRVLEPVEARLMTAVGALLLSLGAIFAFFPRVLVYPLLIILFWFGSALLYRSYQLHQEDKRKKEPFRKRSESNLVKEGKVDSKRD
jgi:cardiolipin synthase A/B